MIKSFTIALIAVLATSACTAESEDAPSTSGTSPSTTEPQSPGTSTTQPEQADLDLASIEGIWMLTSYEVDGTVGRPEVGVNTASIPWIQFTPRDLTGEAGCNDFQTDNYSFENGRLRPVNVAVTMALCMNEDDNVDLMVVEDLLLEFFDGELVLVTSNGRHMELSEGNATLRYEATDSPPTR